MHNYKITILCKSFIVTKNGDALTVEEPFVTLCDRPTFNSAVEFANRVVLAIVSNGDFMSAEIVSVRREKC